MNLLKLIQMIGYENIPVNNIPVTKIFFTRIFPNPNPKPLSL